MTSSTISEIMHAKPDDILCGRGTKYCNHPGNKRYHSIVKLHCIAYKQSQSKEEKTVISRSIVESLRESEIPIRFIQRYTREADGKEVWIDIGDKKAWEKTSQLLREMASKGKHKTVYQKRKWDKEVKRRKRNDEKRKRLTKSSLKSSLLPTIQKYQPSNTSKNTFSPAPSTDGSEIGSACHTSQSALRQYLNDNVASTHVGNTNVDRSNAMTSSMFLNANPTVGNLGQASLQNPTKFASSNLSPPFRSLSNETSRSIMYPLALPRPFRNSMPRPINSPPGQTEFDVLNHALSTQQHFFPPEHSTKFSRQEIPFTLGSSSHDYLMSMLFQSNTRLNTPSTFTNTCLNSSVPISVLMNLGQRDSTY